MIERNDYVLITDTNRKGRVFDYDGDRYLIEDIITFHKTWYIERDFSLLNIKGLMTLHLSNGKELKLSNMNHYEYKTLIENVNNKKIVGSFNANYTNKRYSIPYKNIIALEFEYER